MSSLRVDDLVFVQKQVPDSRRISTKTNLSLTLSRPTLNVSHIFVAGHRGREISFKASLLWTAPLEHATVQRGIPQPNRAIENSPPIHRWVGKPVALSPIRDERKSSQWFSEALSSLAGLGPPTLWTQR